MAYEVIARKWRPQRFEEVVGQAPVVNTLRNAIEQNRIAQAYLLAGPRGTGKTTLARIFAKALNCQHGPTTSPCCTCDACREIAAGTSFDVIEIDGASNNKVEDVHSKIIDTLSFAPVGGHYRIFYIDEVHMLTSSAFNALLKTLEEPPPYVRFIFATTEPEKVLGTILSRCQRFDLRRLALTDIVEQLRKIATAEQIQIDEDALIAIARGADGGMRDAESAFDQMIAFTGQSIHESDVLSVFGLVARGTIEQLVSAILSSDIPQILQLLNTLDTAGKDLRRLVSEILTHFRNLLVCIHLKGNTTSLDLTDDQASTLKKQAEKTQTRAVLAIVEDLIELESKLRLASSQRTMIETTLIRCAYAAQQTDLEAILKKLNQLAALSPNPTPTRTSTPPTPPPAHLPNPAPQTKPQHAPIASADSDALEDASDPLEVPARPETDAEKNEKIIELPVVKDALHIFNGSIAEIKHHSKTR